MIFNVPGHIDMIRNGLHYAVLRQHDPKLVIKTQTRRPNRGIYKVGNDYAVQRKRGVVAEPDIRIVMDRIWEEGAEKQIMGETYPSYGVGISTKDAWQEGNYTPVLYELDFRKAYPKWDGRKRWAFEFHVIEVQK